MSGMSLLTFVVLGLVIAAGSFVQRVIGFGLAVVASPFVVMLAAHVMPVSLLVVVLPMPLLEVLRAHEEILWRPLTWALAGRLATMPLGVWLVSVSSATTIGCIVAVMVLIAVAGSYVRAHVQPTPALSLGAGLITGVSATAASIGGPFFGLVLQDQRPQQVRSTLAPFFFIGALTSLGGLAVAGQVHSAGLLAGLAWMPFMFAGIALAQPARNRLDAARFKRGVLALSALAAIVVLARAAF